VSRAIEHRPALVTKNDDDPTFGENTMTLKPTLSENEPTLRVIVAFGDIVEGVKLTTLRRGYTHLLTE
jgi:hypothetical protein